MAAELDVGEPGSKQIIQEKKEYKLYMVNG